MLSFLQEKSHQDSQLEFAFDIDEAIKTLKHLADYADGTNLYPKCWRVIYLLRMIKEQSRSSEVVKSYRAEFEERMKLFDLDS